MNLRHVVRAPLRAVLQRFQTQPVPTTAAGWERYAQSAIARNRGVGEEWNVGEEIGLLPGTDIVGHIERHVIEPFVGRPQVLLEIGSGGGRWTEVLARRCAMLLAADTAPSMLQLVKRRMGERDGAVQYVLLDGLGLDRAGRSPVRGDSYRHRSARRDRCDAPAVNRRLDIDVLGGGACRDPPGRRWSRWCDPLHVVESLYEGHHGRRHAITPGESRYRAQCAGPYS